MLILAISGIMKGIAVFGFLKRNLRIREVAFKMTSCKVRTETKDSYIWTEALGCGEILPPMLNSFLYHHNHKINVFIYQEDLSYLPRDPRVIPRIITNMGNSLLSREQLEKAFSRGHEGTALLWASIIEQQKNDKLIHLDADSIFLGDVVTELLNVEGSFTVIGSRRPYRYSKATFGLRKLQLFFTPDAINTHCFLFEPNQLSLDLPELKRLILARKRTITEKLFRPVVDFFDPVTFILRKKGGIYYMDSESQSRHGDYSRFGPFESKMISFSAVGSGSAIYKGKTVVASDSYRKFALASFALYSKYLLKNDLNLETLESSFLIEKLENLDMESWELREKRYD